MFFQMIIRFHSFFTKVPQSTEENFIFYCQDNNRAKGFNKNRIISENADCIDYLISSKWRLLLEFYQIPDLCILERENMYHWHMVQPNPYFWKLLFKKPSRK